MHATSCLGGLVVVTDSYAARLACHQSVNGGGLFQGILGFPHVALSRSAEEIKMTRLVG